MAPETDQRCTAEAADQHHDGTVPDPPASRASTGLLDQRLERGTIFSAILPRRRARGRGDGHNRL